MATSAVKKDYPLKRKVDDGPTKPLKRKIDPDFSAIKGLPVTWPEDDQRKIEEFYANKLDGQDSKGIPLIQKPLPNDVLCGRGNAANFHNGNTFFRGLVKEHKLKYISGGKIEKQKLSDLVYKKIRSREPSGRFLKFDPNVHIWMDIGEKKAMEKIRQALRENASEVLQKLKTPRKSKNKNIKINLEIEPDRSAAEVMLQLKMIPGGRQASHKSNTSSNQVAEAVPTFQSQPMFIQNICNRTNQRNTSNYYLNVRGNFPRVQSQPMYTSKICNELNKKNTANYFLNDGRRFSSGQGQPMYTSSMVTETNQKDTSNYFLDEGGKFDDPPEDHMNSQAMPSRNFVSESMKPNLTKNITNSYQPMETSSGFTPYMPLRNRENHGMSTGLGPRYTRYF